MGNRYAEKGRTLRWWSSSCGRFEIALTQREIDRVPNSGASDDAITMLRGSRRIRAQLAKLNPQHVREHLKGYGAWDDKELADHNENLSRVLWLACCDLKEQPDEQAAR